MKWLGGLFAAALTLVAVPFSHVHGADAPTVELAQASRAQPAARPQARRSVGPADGTAVWYGRRFNGRRTASGQRFNAAALTAAHASLPFGSRVRVTNVRNGRSVVVRINDRMASAGPIIDVSQAAGRQLGILRAGKAPVKLTVLSRPAPKPAKAKATAKKPVQKKVAKAKKARRA